MKCLLECLVKKYLRQCVVYREKYLDYRTLVATRNNAQLDLQFFTKWKKCEACRVVLVVGSSFSSSQRCWLMFTE